jgi:hypothetical protein
MAGSAVRVSRPPAALTDAWVHRAERLLHDQCWCWGRDVERVEGNLLLAFGFQRVPTLEGRTFAYEFDREDERVVLAGSGLCYAAPGSTTAALLGRYNVRPRLLPRSEVDTARWATVGASVFMTVGTPEEASPVGHQLLVGVVGWIAGYEAWVRRVAGVDYRERCLASWPRASVVANRMVEEWETLLAGLQGGEGADPS